LGFHLSSSNGRKAVHPPRGRTGVGSHHPRPHAQRSISAPCFLMDSNPTIHPVAGTQNSRPIETGLRREACVLPGLTGQVALSRRYPQEGPFLSWRRGKRKISPLPRPWIRIGRPLRSVSIGTTRRITFLDRPWRMDRKDSAPWGRTRSSCGATVPGQEFQRPFRP